ncbi:MAG: hypothetical protein LBI16_01525 [Burkholderiales bacterium]|jgi:hypothetical protein|nr:hypothetical protein [Burkholderiales bacterium]
MAKAADIPLDISKGHIAINTNAGSYTVGDSVATLFDTVTNNLVISQSGTGSTINTITVTGITPINIMLSGVNIDVSATSYACAFDMTGATVNLTIAGTNTLKSSYSRAGLQVSSNATLTINAAKGTEDSLTTNGGFYGAGIGGGDSASGNITINGGTVNAQGGYHAAGIGGGRNSAGGNITINGGMVNAQGSTEGAGIGGGHRGSGQNTTINGGTANARGGFYAAGIGGGTSGAGGAIVISGGAVTAIGGVNDLAVFGTGGGAGIGSGGNCGVTGNITVAGNAAVEAIGGAGGGAGIGTGGNDGSGWQAGRIIIPGKVISTGTPVAREVKAVGTADYGEYGQGPAIGFGGVNEGGPDAGEGKPIPYETTATYYTVAISAGAGTNVGGVITAFPASNHPAQVPHGANQTFKITPNTGYKIVSVTVDGVNVGAVTSWTIPNITDNTRTITAAFALIAAVTDTPANVSAASSGI